MTLIAAACPVAAKRENAVARRMPRPPCFSFLPVLDAPGTMPADVTGSILWRALICASSIYGQQVSSSGLAVSEQSTGLGLRRRVPESMAARPIHKRSAFLCSNAISAREPVARAPSSLQQQLSLRLFFRDLLQDRQPGVLLFLHESQHLLRGHGARVAADIRQRPFEIRIADNLGQIGTD